MPTPKTLVKRSPSSSSSSLASFDVLVRKVRDTFVLGRKRVQEEMSRTYWLTGKYIHEHILQNKDRADYGEKVISRLAKRVEVSERSLREIHLFYRRAPKNWRRGAKLRWGVLRVLSSIGDETMRDEFAQRAVKENWSGQKLRSKMKLELGRGKAFKNGSDPEDDAREKNESVPADRSLITRPKLGTLYTYRLVRAGAGTVEGSLKIDQGFSVYRTEFDTRARFKEGDIAESLRAEDGTYAAVKSARAPEDLFTYKAAVERVVDGDTLLVEIDLGFTNTTRQYLRLRALDCPELGSADGQRAKEFTAAAVKRAPFLFITSTRSDKYDRYLADVFIPGREFLKAWTAGKAVLRESEDLLYLNNALLEHRLAVRMKG